MLLDGEEGSGLGCCQVVIFGREVLLGGGSGCSWLLFELSVEEKAVSL
jgi:hypothetical protein